MAAGAPGPSEGLGAIGARFATAGRLGAIPASAARIFKAYEAQCVAHGTPPRPFDCDKALGFLYVTMDRGLSNTGLDGTASSLLTYMNCVSEGLSAADENRLREGVKVLSFEFPSEVRRSTPLTDADLSRVRVFFDPFLRRSGIWALSWWALLTLGYAGLYRGGELLGDALTWSQLRSRRLADGSIAVVLDCPFRKTNKNTRDKNYDVGVVPPRTGAFAYLDPFTALAALARASGAAWGQGSTPVFSLRAKLTGKVTRPDAGYPDGAARSDLRWLLGQAGVPLPHSYGLHSMRRGGATFLLAAGAPWSSVKKLGGWRSDALELYDARGAALALSLADFVNSPM